MIFENFNEINLSTYCYNFSLQGENKFGGLCNSAKDKGCTPLEKTFYLQYQWFPLGVAALGFIYYLPYLLYCLVNADLLNIKDSIKKKKCDEVDYEEIVKKHFTSKNKPHGSARTLLNVLVKVLYVVVNVVGMVTIDSAINGEFTAYGREWSTWLGERDKSLFWYF